MKSNSIIIPSLLSLKGPRFNEGLEKLITAGIKIVHFDVMDGVFVPNKALDTQELEAVVAAGFQVHLHLMTKNPKEYYRKLKSRNITACTFQCEAQSKQDNLELLKEIKRDGIRAGIAIKPRTDLQTIEEEMAESQIITVMSVNPGAGGQPFIPESVQRLKDIVKITAPSTEIELDGGVNPVVTKLTKGLVNFYVVGSWLLSSPDLVLTLKEIRQTLI